MADFVDAATRGDARTCGPRGDGTTHQAGHTGTSPSRFQRLAADEGDAPVSAPAEMQTARLF